MEKKIEALENSINALSAELKDFRNLVAAGFKKVDLNFESVGKEIKNIHTQLDSLNKKVDLLKGDTHEGFEDVGLKLENLTEEISKISKVTGYEEHFKNMKIIRN